MKFAAPEKELEKKTVQLDQNTVKTVGTRIAEFKVARVACLVPKNRRDKPSLLTQFTPECGCMRVLR